MRRIALFALITVLLLAACETPPATVPTQPTAEPDPTATTASDEPGSEEDDPSGEEGEACRNEAQIAEDTPVEGGAEVQGGQQVEKSWTLTNTGTCPWTSNYIFTQIGGGLLLATQPEQPLAPTAPGEQLEVTVTLEMSTEAPVGTEQEAVFQLRDAEGNGFGPTPFVLLTPVEGQLDIPTPTPRDG